MKGLSLASLTDELHSVEPQYNDQPILTIGGVEAKLGKWLSYLEEYSDRVRFVDDSHHWPIECFDECFEGFSLDELCKIRYSSIFCMHETVGKLFETEARYEIVRKIESSMWRWGGGAGVWNEVVEAYGGIRRFIFSDDPDFEIRLDHSTYRNERGYSKYSRTFLDGAFAYLVYYRGKHVMTIGFSVVKGRAILIQQVQLTQRSKNRFLFRLPQNRLEYVGNLFKRAFPGYALYVIDGADLVERTLVNYLKALEREENFSQRYRDEIEAALNDEDKKRSQDRLAENERDCEEARMKIRHLEADKQRLTDFYGNPGRGYTFGPTLQLNGLKHHLLVSDEGTRSGLC